MNRDDQERNAILERFLTLRTRYTDVASLAYKVNLHPAVARRHLQYMLDHCPRYLFVADKEHFLLEMPEGVEDEVRDFLAHGGFGQLTAALAEEQQQKKEKAALELEQLRLAISESGRARREARHARWLSWISVAIAAASAVAAFLALRK